MIPIHLFQLSQKNRSINHELFFAPSLNFKKTIILTTKPEANTVIKLSLRSGCSEIETDPRVHLFISKYKVRKNIITSILELSPITEHQEMMHFPIKKHQDNNYQGKIRYLHHSFLLSKRL